MSVEALEEIINAADTDKVVAFFAAMSEPRRKALSEHALEMAREVRAGLGQPEMLAERAEWFRDRVVRGVRNREGFSDLSVEAARRALQLSERASQQARLRSAGPTDTRQPSGRDVKWFRDHLARVVAREESRTALRAPAVREPLEATQAQLTVAKMAVLATCNLPTLKTAGWLARPGAALEARILSDRKPAWLAKWCAFTIAHGRKDSWSVVHELEKVGACVAERDEDYWRGMFRYLSSIRDVDSQILSRDETVRRELWSMLQDPGVKREFFERHGNSFPVIAIWVEGNSSPPR